MWKYEVAYRDTNGVYRFKGFGYADQFEKFLRKLSRSGSEILKVSDWDAEGIGKALKEKYIG